MFNFFHAKNFRCFAGVQLKQLGRVNLIAGKNNTGKTSLLEAIHLHSHPANWELPIQINAARGIEEPAKAMEDVCGWLFTNKHAAGGLELTSWDEKGINRTLTLWILDAVESRERFPGPEQLLGVHANLGDVNVPRLILKALRVL